MSDNRIQREESFHDRQAALRNIEIIDVRQMNEAATSPELRWLFTKIGNLKNKEILDVGAGWGEVSVYLAMKGANVTALDLSSEMLLAAEQLAIKNGVTIKTLHSAIEEVHLATPKKFDIIYLGNLFHHVDIPKTLDVLIPLLKDDGTLISWDPLHYNPLINIYRKIATEVRSEDETPLRTKDVWLITSRFKSSETKFYWFSTLIIFCLMFVVQFKNPNKVRYWKKVVEDSHKWEWLYYPLEKIDKMLLTVFPPLKWLCWNVAIYAAKPKK